MSLYSCSRLFIIAAFAPVCLFKTQPLHAPDEKVRSEIETGKADGAPGTEYLFCFWNFILTIYNNYIKYDETRF